MNTTLNTLSSTSVDEQVPGHPPSWLSHSRPVRRVSVADRVALHVGLALVTWSRRPNRPTDAEPSTQGLRLLRELAQQRQARERDWLVGLYLSQQRR